LSPSTRTATESTLRVPAAAALEPAVPEPALGSAVRTGTAMGILIAISFSHFCNDLLQSLLPAIYPNLKALLALSFGQIGLVTLAYQVTASILQPLVGLVADRRPRPMALPVGTLFTLAGLVVISQAHTYWALLAGAMMLGTGSAVFHPEASRVARMAAGGRHGFAQSVFQVGGNAGSAVGPLFAALIVVRFGTPSIAYAALLALVSAVVLWNVAVWYKNHGLGRLRAAAKRASAVSVPRGAALFGITILLVLVFSKYIYLVSLSNYFTFYLIEKFHVSVQTAQLYLFAYLGATAVGTFAGGPIGDRVGRKYIIWFSILGAVPFALALPFANLFVTLPLVIAIGFILASAFPAIVVYAQELMPGKVGMISGMFFGFAFGVAGLAAVLLGYEADQIGIVAVYRICAFLPFIGLIAAFLPQTTKQPA
jgi:MFS transporter, FSR family, fosmidomycin resistance protein